MWIYWIDDFQFLSFFFIVIKFFPGGRTADDIVNWVKKKTGPPAKQITTVDESKEFIESNNVVVVGFFKDQTSADAKVFLDVASAIDDIPFGITSNEEVYNEHGGSCGAIILFKKVIKKAKTNKNKLVNRVVNVKNVHVFVKKPPWFNCKISDN